MPSTNENKYSVSVIIPAYNIDSYIERAINCALNQTRKPDQIIVVDDGSTDDTADVIKSFGDKVTYIYQQNKGLSGARNTGIKAATSNWIALLDGDDEWLDTYLEKHLALLQRNPHLQWSAGNFIRCLCDENKQFPDIDPAKAKKLLAGKDYFQNYFYAFRNRAGGLPDTMIIRRDTFKTVGLFNEKQIFAEDLDMWWTITCHHPQAGYLTEPLAIYHMTRPGALSEQFQQTKHEIMIALLQKHIAQAEKFNQAENFKPLASFLVTSWTRGLFFNNQPEKIKTLTDTFGHLLTIKFKLLVKFLMINPAVTATTCHAISKLVRKSGLRKKAIRNPQTPKAAK